MALNALSSALRRVCIQPSLQRMSDMRKIQSYFESYDPELGYDTDEDSRSGYTPKSPLDPNQRPGFRNEFERQSSWYAYQLVNMNKPQVQQPAYFSYPIDFQTYHVFNANAQPLGRMAIQIAHILQGKHKPIYTHKFQVPLEYADFVIVVNGVRPMLTGPKGKNKIYKSHSGRPGGLKEIPIPRVLSGAHWDKVVKKAVHGMLPRNRLRKRYLERLFVYQDIYHDKDFLPQMVPRPAIDHNEALGFNKLLSDSPETVLLATNEESKDQRPAHLSQAKEEFIDIYSPIADRGIVYPEIDSKYYKERKKWLRKMRRYRIYNYDTKKFEV